LRARSTLAIAFFPVFDLAIVLFRWGSVQS